MRLASCVRTALLAGGLVCVAACGEPAAPVTATPARSAIAQQPPLPGLRVRPLTDRVFERTDARRERGRYLADGILQCALCHSDRDWGQPGAPPVQSRTMAGHVWKDEGATRLVAPNLTSDVETGVGGWSDDMLARAIREGISHDGRPLHPQMWYPSFSMLSDEDLAAVVVYLRSLPAIRNPLPRTQLSDEQVQRIVGRPMPITAPVSGPVDDSPLERGRYLAAIGDCGGCHTLWEGKRLPGAFAGGNAISRDGRDIYSTNLTPHPTGIDYDAAAFVQLMRTGKQGLTHPMMPWVAFRHLGDEDLRALHAFLQTRHPVAHAISNLAPPTLCAVCGQEHGLGSINRLQKTKGVTVSDAILRDYVGTYRVERYDWTLRITFAHGRLHAQSADEAPVELVPLDDTLFAMDGGLGPLRFRRGANGKVDAVVSQDVDDVVLARIGDAVASAR
ncbi:c-type cytochrome [Pseudoxanthomonas sp.]|uniref:c-type cytochrome n=1 Tax=Pseudoxanthomonas sp. TaxID=1871049 RepID=UPI002FE27549